MILISCAATPNPFTKLGGNPAILTIGSILGMPENQLIDKLGPPVEVGECSIHFSDGNRTIQIIGHGLIWTHEIDNIKENLSSVYSLEACLLYDHTVVEVNRWIKEEHGQLKSGYTDSMDLNLLKHFINNNDTKDPIPLNNESKLEI